MNINIRPIDFTIRPSLKDFIQSKAEKLFRICPDLIKTDVVLKNINTNDAANKRCEIRMMIPGNDLIASQNAKTFEEAILQTVEVLSRKVKVRKNKRIDYSLYIL
jgi:putative sigma-54 modulation protein